MCVGGRKLLCPTVVNPRPTQKTSLSHCCHMGVRPGTPASVPLCFNANLPLFNAKLPPYCNANLPPYFNAIPLSCHVSLLSTSTAPKAKAHRKEPSSQCSHLWSVMPLPEDGLTAEELDKLTVDNVRDVGYVLAVASRSLSSDPGRSCSYGAFMSGFSR